MPDVRDDRDEGRGVGLDRKRLLQDVLAELMGSGRRVSRWEAVETHGKEEKGGGNTKKGSGRRWIHKDRT